MKSVVGFCPKGPKGTKTGSLMFKLPRVLRGESKLLDDLTEYFVSLLDMNDTVEE